MRRYQFKPDPDAFVSYYALTLDEIGLLRLLEPPDPAAFAAIELRTDNPDAAATAFPPSRFPRRC
jgi:hypothetical protein